MRLYRLFLLLAFALLPGCDEMVDVQLFATATMDMGAAVDGGLQQVQADLEQAATVFQPAPDQKELWKKDLQAVKGGASAFQEVAHQFDAYAKALVQVAESGKQKDERIDKAFKVTQALAAASMNFLSPLQAPFIEPFKTALGKLDTSVQKITNQHTNRKLKSLASPEQEERIQTIARALKAGLAEYATIDAAAFNLLQDNDKKHDLVRRYAGFAQQRQAYAVVRLEKLVEAETTLLEHPTQDGRLGDKGGLLDELDAQHADPALTIHQAFATFKNGQPKRPNQRALPPHSAAAHAALLATLREREHYYLPFLDGKLLDNQVPMNLAEAEQARWNAYIGIPQQTSLALFAKSQQLIGAWATSHHELRHALLKSGQVTRQDLVAQAQDIRTLVTYLQAAKDAAAKAAKDAADKAAKEEADRKAAGEAATN